MGNLIEKIPVYTPQAQTQRKSTSSVDTGALNNIRENHLLTEIQNRFPQDKIYTYIQAEPISPAKTRPAGIKARKPSGELIKENIFQSAASTVKSYGDYAKFFYNAAFKGEGKDYSVGKINDLSIRAGSLGIAAVLAGTKFFPFARGMEFVGLATWFASMAVWPKILGVPIKALYGVDINQKYKDSDNRVKMVYEDNQYRPIDIFRYVDVDGTPMSEEEYHKKYNRDYIYLEKIGDKLGIPKDIKNRNEATMNKMGQIAVQGKTLWMLTAGVMTPVLSSLAADALQKPFKDTLGFFRTYIHSNNLNQLQQHVEKMLGNQNVPRTTDINKLFEEFKINIPKDVENEFLSLIPEDGIFSQEQFDRLKNFLEKRFYGTGIHTSLDAAMKIDAKMTEPYVSLNDEFKTQLRNLVKESFDEVIAKLPADKKAKLPESFINYQGMNAETLNNLLKELSLDGVNDLNKVNQDVLRKYLSLGVAAPFEKDMQGNRLLREALNRIKASISEKTLALYDSKRHYIISKQHIEKIFKFTEMNLQLRDSIKLFEKATIKNISESATAISWETVPQKYLKALGFSNKELAILATVDSDRASKLIAERLEKIAANESLYQKVLQTMSKYAQKAVSKEEKAVIQLVGTIDNPGALFKLRELMTSCAQANFGWGMAKSVSDFYNISIHNVQRKFRNTMDSFIRPIKALDVFKHLDELVERMIGNEFMFNERKGNPDYHMFTDMSFSTAKASVKKYIKNIILQKNDINDWTTKMEVELPAGKRGLKSSFPVLCSLAEQIFSPLHEDTVRIITGNNPKKVPQNKAFIRKLDVNNWIMKSRFLRIDYKLSELNGAENYMTQKEALNGFIQDLRYPEKANAAYNILSEILEDRIADVGERIVPGGNTLTLERLKNYKKILEDFRSGQYKLIPGYNIESSIQCLKESSCFEFKTANKAISEMSGKNITDFIVSAAQNQRSRNKWLKLVYGLLIGSLAVSAYTIANMGHKNKFNKDIYETKQPSQGALK